jgi:2-phospho-L-lactate guanylyltransferase
MAATGSRSIWAIVPVKPFLRSKSRLAGVLSPQERAGLSRDFLGHALEVLRQVPAIRQTLVISRDPGALAAAHALGARTVTEAGAPDLNAALTRATRAAKVQGAGAILILPTDLPLLAPEDVIELTDMDGPEPLVAIAPDRREAGTNALFVSPPGLIEYVFGERSFARHVALAQAAGARLRVCRLAGAALDIDGPEDLELYRAGRLARPE